MPAELYDRIHQALDQLGVSREIGNVHKLFTLMMDLFPQWTEIIKLRAERNNAVREVELQRRRTDKIREAVAAYLAGEISKKKLERALNNTDYSSSISE